MSESELPVVLLVDDNEEFTRAQAELLGTDYDVRTAFGGEEALDVYDDDVDVVILDRHMPDMRGDEVAERIRERDGTTQIVMITAVEPSVDIIELGIDDYVLKPVRTEEMEEHVEAALKRQRYDDSLQGYFSLANKRAALADKPEARRTEQFSQLQNLVEEMAREQLEIREEQFRTLVNHAPVAITTLDEEGLVDVWNPAATDLFGWSKSEVVGEEPPIFAQDQGELEYARSRLFQNTIVSDLDLTCPTSEGSTVDVSLSAAPLTADGEIYGTLFVFLDVTERKQRSQQVTVMNRVLRHNIRNELNLMMGWLTELDRQLTGERSDFVEEALEAARRIDSMAQKARDIQHTLAEDRDVLELDLVEIIELQIERANQEFGHLTVETSLPENASILAIRDISDAIWEVIENAVIHNPHDEPTIYIAVKYVQEGGTDYVELRVHDDGPGIPDEERRVLFEGGEEKLDHGSGLGLWYVKWLADRSDASMSFDQSRFRGGTAVHLRFRSAASSG